MNTTLRLALTMLLCFIVCLCIVPSAYAETVVDSGTCGAQGNNLTWTLYDNGKLVINGTGAMADYPWTDTPPQRPWEEYRNSITELVVNDGVTALGSSAFYQMYYLQNVVLPEGITSLPFQVFALCVNLKDINFPASLTTLENECLFGTGIETLNIPSTVIKVSGHFYGGSWGAASKRFETAPDHPVFTAIDGVLFTKDLSTLVMFPCCDLTAYTVPDGTTQIREHAFAYLFTLETVNIPATVSSIGSFAFRSNPGQSTSLHDIYYNGTKDAWINALVNPFFSQNTLQRVTVHCADGDICLSDSGTCSAQGDNLTWTLYDNGEMVIASTGLGNGRMADYYQNSQPPWSQYKAVLRKVIIKPDVTNIGSSAFYECSGLTSVTIPNSVTSIGSFAFYGCSGLTSVTIPNSVTIISDRAFTACSGLTSITIPDSVTSILKAAFSACNGLTSVTIPKSVTSIGDAAFGNCSGLKAIYVDPANTVFCDLDGVLCSKDMTVLCEFPYAKSEDYEIPDGITRIGNDAFSGCFKLTSVTIPNSVTSIGFYAFSGCIGLTNIIIPDSVTSFDLAFMGCSGLTSVTIPNGITNIGHATFAECSALTSVTIPDSVTSIDTAAFSGCSGLTSITIPNSVTDIGNESFYGCSKLENMTIPNSVTSVGYRAFENCTSLTDIYFTGTQEQWNQISFGDEHKYLDDATIHYLTIPDFILPADLISIEEQAFAGGAFIYPKLSANTVSIGRGAFADCPNLAYIYIPEATTSIDPNAFDKVAGLTIFGKTGSTAETYAKTHGFTFVAVS